MIRLTDEETEHHRIEYLEPPLIKEILEQQRMILEMQKHLVEVLMRPPLIYLKKEKVSK